MSYVDPMKKLYDREYLRQTLGIISDNLDDLAKWSVWNQDEKLEEITQMTEFFDLLKKQLSK